MSNEQGNDRSTSALAPLVPMSYISTALLGVVIVVLSIVQESTMTTLAAAVLLMLAIGGYLGLRWTMVVSGLLAAALLTMSIVGWMSGMARPPAIFLVVPPIVIVFNAIGFHYSTPPEASKSQ